MSRLSEAQARFDKATAEVQAAAVELAAAEEEELSVNPTQKAIRGRKLKPGMLGDGVVVWEQNHFEMDDEEYGLRTIYRGPDIENGPAWWVHDGGFAALYPEKLLLKSFVGTGKRESFMKSPREVPPKCKCGAYHHPGANDGLCAY